MTASFADQPILNSPYACPTQHWELDQEGMPTQHIIAKRRAARLIRPIPQPRRAAGQGQLAIEDAEYCDANGQHYRHSELIDHLRHAVAAWRALPAKEWAVTAETARLLSHWRNPPTEGIRPFFCQVEAAETVIWLTEVAPSGGQAGRQALQHLEQVNLDANPGLARLALKLATGAGKTTVMAMLIAWQTINAVRYPKSNKFTRGFLLVAPGLTIKDRLRVLLPNDADSYYQHRHIVPGELLPELGKAKIVITNYHAFKRREQWKLSKGGQRLLQGRSGAPLDTLESEGHMLARVMPELLGLKSIMVFNDEAHHCYREKPQDAAPDTECNAETQANNEAARVWISGLEAASRQWKLRRVIDLSATPFFLAGSGYQEGTLFPWTMSDFSLLDAIECGIVKLPRVPVADNLPSKEASMPLYRDLWQHIGRDMPKKGRGKNATLDPLALPLKLQTALETLYGNYAKTFDLWQRVGSAVPPCFIVVCNNTATSKLVFDYIAGFQRSDGSLEQGRLPLLRNWDEQGQALARPHTLLIDSQQLESGEALDGHFHSLACDEIARFKRDIITRTGDRKQADSLSDSDILREVMNTVGKPGRLGEHIRCVVSVAMLTEGWDANTVTHILGVRAFGTQLLCEQVMGRALRRQSYELNAQGLFDVEYAEIFGIPFNFAGKSRTTSPPPPREVTTVRALRPERDHLEIRFPRVQGYRVEWPQTRLEACFSADHCLTLTPAMVGATRTHNVGIIGAGVELNIGHLESIRPATLVMELTRHLLMQHWREPGQSAPLALYGQLKPIVRQWLEQCLQCQGGISIAQLQYRELADLACERITKGIVAREREKGRHIRALQDPYNPTGSTAHVYFQTTRPSAQRWNTQGVDNRPKNPINWVIVDSTWEAEFCRLIESHPQVLAYTKNHLLGLEVPYRMGSNSRRYLPDFIVLIDDGRGAEDPLHLIVEIKGYRGEDAKEKAATMRDYWIPGVNHLGTHGRWAFVELTELWGMQDDLAEALPIVREAVVRMVDAR